ncbi:Angiotensin-Converting Enzyme [Manis pentadactyla]|nr:Angiotensin-Converting Enzyme [Manis pentadactyla]
MDKYYIDIWILRLKHRELPAPPFPSVTHHKQSPKLHCTDITDFCLPRLPSNDWHFCKSMLGTF